MTKVDTALSCRSSAQKKPFEELDQRTVAYHLLVELLAQVVCCTNSLFQIDTQDALFNTMPNKAITRFVELGPSNVLANMAKRTGDLKYATRDRILGLRRKFLASTKNSTDIFYEYESTTAPQAQDLPSSSSSAGQNTPMQPVSPTTTSTAHQPPLHVPTIAAQAFTIAATSLADVPITPLETVRALIAYKLNRNIDQIPGNKTIKELSGGKSTLQNEIVGDLAAEFGHTPDGAEDTTLESLAESLQTHHTGQLGKVSSTLIARFISSSMPAKVNLTFVREHLEQTWGLGTSRQSSVLLFALTLNTVSGTKRLASIASAKELLDKAAQTYAKSCGVTLQAHSDDKAKTVITNPVVDHKVLLSVQEEARNQRQLATKQVRALSEYLGINPGKTIDSEIETLDQDRAFNLSVWEAEFGGDFAMGIRSRFDTRHVRRFNFSWNQVRQELISLYHRTESAFRSTAFSKDSTDRVRDLASEISNKSTVHTPRLVRVLLDFVPEDIRDSHPFYEIGNALIENMHKTVHLPPRARFDMPLSMPQTSIAEDGSIQYQEVPRTGFTEASYSNLVRGSQQQSSRIFLRHAGKLSSEEDVGLTNLYFENLSDLLQNGASFSEKCILVTGAGSGSIGVELIKHLLNGGAHVIVATSRHPSSSSQFYRDIYVEHGARGSQLHVVPFNQASAVDCKELIEYIYRANGLALNLDAIIPFAAVSEEGIEVDNITGKSELAHRIMLTNVLRTLGHISRCKKEHNITCRPTQVILPLSPNHGIFGGDGLYSESKLGLEGLLNRFHSESWSEDMTILGAIIGWTRGTGLMQQNDIVAQAVEEAGVLTFSQNEMALNILTLLSPAIAETCDDSSIIADFSGGLGRLEKCNQVLSSAREKIRLDSQISKAVQEEDRLETQCFTNTPFIHDPQPPMLPRTTLQLPFPSLPVFARDLAPLHHLQGMADLSGTVVIVGYSELGPWGNARTRWEKESRNVLSQSAYIELSWMMNLIKHFDGDTPDGYFVGWVDTKTGARVLDSEVENKYGAFVLSHSGIRFIDPSLSNGYDPAKKESLQEIVVEEDLPEFETDLATAEGIRLRSGDKVSITRVDGQDQCRVTVKSGAHIMVPRSSNFDSSLVAGQLPSGWDPASYGVEKDIINQVDPVTTYALCCVAEALFSAGITNAMEMYKHIHTSELGNFIGSSMGGTDKTRQMYRDVYLDKRVQGDIIQETFLNTPAAWVNMLLLGSNGPIKTPVGACATGVESIDIGFDSIVSGKTKMCLVGGTDNFHEDESYAFSTMKATVDTASELLHGRTPSEMSRPTAESRAGFVESQGCGVQILCSAELAIEMGLPIYGIVAGTTMAADKISRSVPAPGQGVLTFARETHQAVHSPLLNILYRKEQMQQAIARALEADCQTLSDTGMLTPESSVSDSGGEEHSTSKNTFARSTLNYRILAAQRQWGNEFRRMDQTLSPLRASLAVWGLTVDDISVASLHGTSTKANDKNEPDVLNQQMSHLGRTGPPLLSICQKSVTGHPKAPASSWMLNGCLQVMDTGLVPGNYNADNVDPLLEKFEHLVFPTAPIQMIEVKAFILTSFGFGQKGGQLIGVNPKYVFATLSKECFDEYATKVTLRKRLANRAFAKAVLTNSVFKAQIAPPYDPIDEAKIFLNPLARISEIPGTGEYRFEQKNITQSTVVTKVPLSIADITTTATANLATALSQSKTWISKTVANASEEIRVGIDVEELDTFTSDKNEVFVIRNYTEDEISFANKSFDPHRTFVGRWCAKEAVFKSLGTRSKGAGAALKDIEIVDNGMGLSVKLHGEAKAAAHEKDIQGIEISITYSGNSVAAVALARKGQ
ncbi:hypothetical protein VTL71DRAFT_7416 [Oculimacula yallundae]|uniref:Beta-ketoacyl-[acyl-carrier-protein] synthase I n=1 Tax=Oculimacula yallundae TaxID=86028 RepID=A0ABR4BU44_9HELO